VGEAAYTLELPSLLSDVHDVFHISQLKKGLKPHDKQTLPMDGSNIKDNLTYTERPVRVLDTLARVTRNRVIKMCKVQWTNHAEDDATWEIEDELKEDHPHLLNDPSESRGRDSS
jgi:hypothetical protein